MISKYRKNHQLKSILMTEANKEIFRCIVHWTPNEQNDEKTPDKKKDFKFQERKSMLKNETIHGEIYQQFEKDLEQIQKLDQEKDSLISSLFIQLQNQVKFMKSLNLNNCQVQNFENYLKKIENISLTRIDTTVFDPTFRLLEEKESVYISNQERVKELTEWVEKSNIKKEPEVTIEEKSALTIQKYYKRYQIFKKWKWIIKNFINSKEAKPLLERNKIIKEIIKTERHYFKCLSEIKNLYLQPLKNEKKMDILDIEEIFINVVQIYLVHQVLLHELEDSINHWPRIYLGDVFLSHLHFFQLYEEYINKYDQAAQLLKIKRKKDFIFDEFCNHNQKKTIGSLNLSSLLIMPVQRLPRYKLLLEQLIKNTNKEHLDYEPLNKAVNILNETIKSINERKKEFESSHIISEICNNIGKKAQKFELGKREFLLMKNVEYNKQSNRYVYIFTGLILIFSTKLKSFSKSFKTLTNEEHKQKSFSNLQFENYIILNKQTILTRYESEIQMKQDKIIHSFHVESKYKGEMILMMEALNEAINKFI